MAKRKKKSQESKKRTTKRNNSVLEYEIMRMMQSCLKVAINSALDEIFKE